MKTLIMLLSILSLSSHALELSDLEGVYALNPLSRDDCAEEFSVRDLSRPDAEIAHFQEIKGVIGSLNIVNFSRTKPKFIRVGVYHSYENKLDETGEVILHTRGLLKIKRKRKKVWDFSNFNLSHEVTIIERKGRKVNKICTYKRVKDLPY